MLRENFQWQLCEAPKQSVPGQIDTAHYWKNFSRKKHFHQCATNREPAHYEDDLGTIHTHTYTCNVRYLMDVIGRCVPRLTLI